MFAIRSPIGTEIFIPETVEENSPSFGLDELSTATAYYLEHGYVVLRGAVPPAICDKMRKTFDDTVKKYPGYIYRQTTANPEKNQINEFGFVMNPVLNIQSLRNDNFCQFKNLAAEIFGSDPVKNFCREIFSDDPKLVQSMYFEGNSETWPHQDTYYLDSEVIGTLVGCWYALEDIDAGAGRFFVIPGSHRISTARNGDDIDYAFHHDRYIDLVKRIISENNLKFNAPLLKKGDVLFWNSKTIHGSLHTARPQFSRNSLTAHYIPESHRFLQFQSIIKPLKIRRFGDMNFHCPKDLDRLSNRAILTIETSFPKTFQMAKKIAIKALVK